MNKKIIIIIISVLLVIGVAVGVFFAFFFDKNKEENNKNEADISVSIGENLLKVTGVDELKELLKNIKTETYFAEDNSTAAVYGFDLFGEQCNITYYFDEQKKPKEYATYFIFNNQLDEEAEIEKMEAKDLEYEASTFIFEFCKMFGCETRPTIYLTEKNGNVSVLDSTDGYQKIIDGKARIDFSVMDKDGSYWLLRINTINGACNGNITRYFNTEEYKNYFANISLYEEN